MVSNLGLELVAMHLSHEECQRNRAVSKQWDQVLAKVLIDRLNSGIPFADLFPIQSYENLQSWLTRNPKSVELKHADFRGMQEMRRGDWTQLHTLCSKISKLKLATRVEPDCSMLSKTGLGSMGTFPNLTVIDLSGNSQFFGDEVAPLLTATSSLKSVNLLGLIYLQDKHLKGLERQSELSELNIAGCQTLGAQFLNLLSHLPQLRDLNIEECTQFESTCLMNLRHTPLLERINFLGCWQLGEVNMALLPPTKLSETKAIMGKHTFLLGKL